MQFTEDPPDQRQTIEAYGAGGFRAGGQSYRGSILITPEAVRPWPVATMDDVSAEAFAPLFEMTEHFSILVLGCGPAMTLVGPDIRQPLRERGVVVEPMDSGAACRTYNVLLTEGRPVAAAIVAIE